MYVMEFNLNKIKRIIVCNTLIAAPFISSNCIAGEKNWLPDSVQIHGFLSQAIIHTSDNNFFGNSDDSISTDFRELGINGSWRIIPDLQIAMQVVWRDAGLTDEQGLRIDYGLADYRLYSSEESLLGIKAGRVPAPLGLYNDTRDVASTRPGIFLPQSIYFDINRNIALSSDGGYLYGEQNTDWGDFSFNLGVVNPRSDDDPDFKQLIVGNNQGKMEGQASWGGRINYEWRSGEVRLAITYAEFNSRFIPTAASNNVGSGQVKVTPLIFSAQYNAEKWSLTGEYEFRNLRLNNFGLFPDSDTTGTGYYLQGIYKFTSYLEGMIRYDELIWDKDDKNGEKFAMKYGRPAYSRFAKDWTVGLRLKIIPNLLLSTEYHRINGTGAISTLENTGPTKQHWDLYSVMLSYDF
ncbi:hypothetical protein [Methylobacter marinus]|uniref:hypothetical protein n=1 Tax=Methylobacter marinus TaxID=34058 RepID=UPI00036506DC|nr:hypothetical protein [Methylobacter marinus]